MKNLYKILCALMLALLWYACSNNENEVIPVVKPDASGVMTDTRDGYVYHWVRYNGLDWTVENSHYNTNDGNCSVYTLSSGGYIDSAQWEKYGYLYTYAGALEAAPKGWRVPTDEDWKTLEKTLGMTDKEANALNWRGSYAAILMKQESTGTNLNFLCGGYRTTVTSSYFMFRLMNDYGFYWTSTKDTAKSDGMVFYRKIFYNSPMVFRYSTTCNNMFSVRFVRDSQ